jgi:Carboxypeptidase regulatory-like domain/TonB dependent receptor-like, beta-barrel
MTHHYRAFLHLTAVLALSILAAVGVAAQQTTGDIQGRVTDSLGNIVPNASVTAHNTGTGLTRTATSDEAGEFTVAQLPAGRYDVTVEARSFSKTLLKDLELNVGATQTLKIELKPGEISETVEVVSDAALVETTTSELGRNITPIEVQNLPLINRTFANLSVIAPEARPVGNFDPTKTRVGNIAFSGGDGRQVDVNVDGGDNKDNVVGSLLQNFAYESIQEFQVLQHRWTAESGRSVGGVVNVITKSGSNDFHGSAFYNFRNQSLRARDFFEKQNNSEKPDFSRQEFGGSFGGRIIRDKLFFFGAYERFRERQNLLVQPDQLAQIAAIPGVTATDIIPTPYNDNLFSVKIDNRISDKQSMFYRYSYQKNDSPNDQFDITFPADILGGNTNNNTLHSFVVNHSYTISPTKLNQFSFQFQDFKNSILGVTDAPNLLFPSVQSGANTNVPQETTERKWQFRDDFSVQTGNHGLKFGVNYIRTTLGGFFLFGANGYQITFFDDPLTIRNNLNGRYPQGFATPGAVAQIDFSAGDGDTSQPTIHQLAFYAQDDWRVTPRLTLNLGLRWDANVNLLIDQTQNRTMRILSQLNEQRARAITTDDLSKTTPSYREFQPRFGFAYDVRGDGRTVVRGGYGIFYDQVFSNLTVFSLQQTHPIIYQTLLSQVNSEVGVGQLATFRFGVDPLPAPVGATGTDLEPGAFGRINDPRMRDPYVQKFSIGFETQLGTKYVLSSDFVHTLGLHEPIVLNINPRISSVCNPAFPGSTPASPRCVRGATTRYFDQAFVAAGLGAGRLEQTNMFTSTNRSRFDSWTTTLRRRTRRTLFSASYVLSSAKSWGGLPTASYSGNGAAVTPEDQFRPDMFGPSRIDERHRIVMSGVFDVPYGFQLAPILQYATARPFSLNAGLDIDGDGRGGPPQGVDRICVGVDPAAVFAARGNSATLRALNPLGCQQIQVNTEREGFITDAAGNIIERRSGRYFNVDLRVQKVFSLGEKYKIKAFMNFFNLFNTENLSFGDRLGHTYATSSGNFLQPASLYGPGFGPPVGIPFTLQLGARFDF